MRSREQWLLEYGESHQNRTNQLIHKICVPAIFFCAVALIKMIPFKFAGLNLSDILISIVMLWYLSLGKRVFALMFVVTSICMAIAHNWRIKSDYYLESVILLFVVAWIGQFIGHRIEGKKPSFFKDLQFLLIGPVWVFYRR